MNKTLEKLTLNNLLKTNITMIRHFEEQIEDYGECELARSNLRELHAEQEQIKQAYWESLVKFRGRK